MHQSKPIRTKFSIQINLSSDWSKPNFQSEIMRMNRRSELLRIDSDWIEINRIKSDWFLTIFHQTRCKTFFGLVRIDSDWIEINRIKLNWFLTIFHQTKCKTFFGLVRNDSETNSGIALIRSEWISIRYFREGKF